MYLPSLQQPLLHPEALWLALRSVQTKIAVHNRCLFQVEFQKSNKNALHQKPVLQQSEGSGRVRLAAAVSSHSHTSLARYTSTTFAAE
jgi:hypothetical protein